MERPLKIRDAISDCLSEAPWPDSMVVLGLTMGRSALAGELCQRPSQLWAVAYELRRLLHWP